MTRATLRRRRILRRLTAFAMLLCVIGAGIYLTMTMLFRINSIQVQTPDGKQVTEIAGYSADSILQRMGVQLEENIFSFEPGEKAAVLEQNFPLLGSIKVIRDYPNTVVVPGDRSRARLRGAKRQQVACDLGQMEDPVRGKHPARGALHPVRR